jgi:hypothetical protein
VESRFELGIKCSNTMRNYQLSQKLKLLGNGKYNHLINILTNTFIRKSLDCKM